MVMVSKVGVLVSTIIAKTLEILLALPAVSVAVAVMLCAFVLLVRAMSIENFPLLLAVTKAPVIAVPARYNCTVVPASASPVMVKSFIWLVVLSDLEPELSSLANARLLGAIGTVVSTACVLLAGEVFVSSSVARAVAASLATVTTKSPSKFALGVTSKVYLVPSVTPFSPATAAKVPLALASFLAVVPSLTVISLMSNPVTASSKVKV